jgi:hypothetical protein
MCGLRSGRRLFGNGVLKHIKLLFMLENNSQVAIPIEEVSMAQLVLLKDRA